MLTELQRRALLRVRRAELAGEDAWFRAETAGDRVTLASLETTHRLLVRRPWRGDGISRDSAFEYRLADELRDALDRKGTK